MKSGRVKGGAAIPAVIDTGRRTRSSMAQPVFNASGLNRGVQGGAAQNIIQITSEDLVQNGGQYSLIGGTPIPMEIVTGRRSKQGAATVVYPVDMLGNYDPSFAGYIYKVLTANPAAGYDPTGLIGFWPQNELAGGVSYDHSGLGHHGAYTAVNLGQAGVPGMGMTSAGYDGATSFNNIYSASLAAAFSALTGTLLVHGRIINAGVWTDASSRMLVSLTAAATNRIRMGRTVVNNQLFIEYVAGGVSEQVAVNSAPLGTLDWWTIGMTWDKAGDAVIAYYNGVQAGLPQAIAGVWVGALLATHTNLGSYSTAPANVLSGNEGPALLYNTVKTPAEMLYLSTV